MHDEEASVEQLIQAVVAIARQSITGPSNPPSDQESPPEVSHQNRAMARAIELAGGRNAIEGGSPSQLLPMV